jgi:regulator of nonsense transcripts 1
LLCASPDHTTGKTTVIAAAVTSIMASSTGKETVWLTAQSNVAVKNIAEKLVAVGFMDFKIIVSKDFHYDWYFLCYARCNFPDDVQARTSL